MEFNLEVSGRVAKAEIRLFDDLHAEILDAHMSEKLRHAQNIETRGIRSYRKPGKCGRKYWKFPNKGNVSNAEFRARKMAPMLEADWELELYAECVEKSIAELRAESLQEFHAEILSEARWMEDWLAWA